MLQGPISEDCLYLNVWTLAGYQGRNFPVYVFFHGGGFTEGAGSIDVYNGASLARKGLVVVTVNYRLGALGFLAHPALSAESTDHISGNYGFLDALQSLRWVKNNIGAFGSDPSRVIIGGQSAGSMLVHDLSASPQAKGLFRAAVAESGSSLAFRSETLAHAEKDGTDYAATLKANSVADLRKLNADAFLPRDSSSGGLRFSPIVDGHYLPQAALASSRVELRVMFLC
jgi:para-nitrobenzyl esterase